MERRRKRLFNNYFKQNDNKYILVYEYNKDFYLVSNGISILKIRKNNDLIISENNEGKEKLINYLDSFKDYQDYGKRITSDFQEFNTIAKYYNGGNDYNEYGVNKKLLDICSDIIIPKNIKVLEKVDNSIQCVVYMENKDTSELAYILPTRIY